SRTPQRKSQDPPLSPPLHFPNNRRFRQGSEPGFVDIIESRQRFSPFWQPDCYSPHPPTDTSVKLRIASRGVGRSRLQLPAKPSCPPLLDSIPPPVRMALETPLSVRKMGNGAMKCTQKGCTKAATLHITEVLGEDQFEELHLCEE